jgi:TonB family protein
MQNLAGWWQTAFTFLVCAFSVMAQHDQRQLVEAVAPVYPMVAVYSGTAGEVTVKVTIDGTGAVTAAKAIEGHKLLVASAEDAAKRWRFTPGSGATELPIVFLYRILPKGTPDAVLATRFQPPNQIEIRRVIPEASTNSDPAPDPPRRRGK